jgi:hypothetical protein
MPKSDDSIHALRIQCRRLDPNGDEGTSDEAY